MGWGWDRGSGGFHLEGPVSARRLSMDSVQKSGTKLMCTGLTLGPWLG